MTAETSNARGAWVLERLRGVLEHGKMGDKCLIAPDLVTAAIASLSAPQPPAEAQERPEKPAECADGCPPQQVCDHCQWPPGPDAEAQAQGGGEVAGWVFEDTFVNAKFWTADTPPQGWTPVYYTAPPSAPVGVEGLLADLETIWHSVSDDKETNAAYQRLKSALAQQPAAVDEAMLERALIADAREYGASIPESRARRLLTAALAQQPEARGVVDEGSRSVTRQLLHWGGVPVHVTGTVTTSPGNWSLIDAALTGERNG